VFESKVEQRLTRLGVPTEKLKSFDVLILPAGIESETDENPSFDVDENVILSKVLRSKNIRCGTIKDLDVNRRFIERRGADLWLGFVWVLTNVALPTVLGVVSSYLYERTKKKESSSEPKQIVHVTLCIQRGNQQALIQYDGPADACTTILEGLGRLKDGGDERPAISE
jgi:hypothetical protein